jgi:glycosyltransferase involved in cell wall biosynthesis
MLSVIMTSHNGMGTLPRTLESFTKLIPPEGAWKLFAVDNASTDDTRHLLESYSDRLPLRIIRHDKLGQATSRNAAIPLAEGELVVFTDDDVIAEPNWILSLYDAAATHQDYDIFGGAIKPLWPEDPPKWITDHGSLGMTFGATSPALPEGPVNPGLIWGANMAIRTKIFKAGRLFDERFFPNWARNTLQYPSGKGRASYLACFVRRRTPHNS